MKQRTRLVKDYHSLSVWNEARSLTAAVYQLTGETSRRRRAPRLTNEIQQACVSVLSNLQRLEETGARSLAESTAKKLGHLLAEAHARGLIGTYDVNLMIRGVQSLAESLGNIPGRRR